MNINDLKIAQRIQRRINSLAKEIIYIHPDHDSTDNPSIQWELNDEDGTEIFLQIYTAEMKNDSCHCHPEWYLGESHSYHTFSSDYILNDEYFDEENDDCNSNHPFLENMRKEIEEEKQRKKEEAGQRALEEARRLARQQEQNDRKELERLKQKYGE